MKRPLVVLKIGTSALTRDDGTLDQPVMVEIARQISRTIDRYRWVIVSSGAVGTGKRYLPHFQGKLIERKAAAAIGNPILINTYSQFFAPYGIAIAQSLCERRHFSDRQQFLQLRATFHELWKHNIIPIANENDVVSDLELRFSDNDELATLLAVGFGADMLLMATSVPGVYDPSGTLVPHLPVIDDQVLSWAQKSTSTLGLGGMISKLTFARLATHLGIKVNIFGLKGAESILQALNEQTGTLCSPQAASLSARQKWLASGSLVRGSIEVDEGAALALSERKSLLAVGIKRILSPFAQGEVIEICRPDGQRLALGRTKLSSSQIEALQEKKNIAVAHADDIVLLTPDHE